MIHNPIIRGFNPDPSITFDGKRYIIAVSTFEYYPGVALYVSDDLSRWSYASSVLTEENGFSLKGLKNSSGVYAPAIRFHNGRYYVTTTIKNGLGNVIVYSDSIFGPWSEVFKITPEGIDPSICFFDDGSCFYTQNGKGGIFGAFINPDNGELQEPLRNISSGLDGYATEAPHIFQKDGLYYLIFAEGGTEYGHHEIAGRSESIYGPYELREKPILSHTKRKNHPIQATGHADFLEADNKWYAVFLGIRMPGHPLIHNLGRETFLAEMKWIDGWPVIGNDGWIELEEPSKLETAIPDKPYFHFSEDIDSSPVLRVRTGRNELYESNGRSLVMHSSDPLSNEKCEPSALLLRQTEFESVFHAELRTDNTLTGKAGVTAFYNSDYHADLYIERLDDKLIVRLRRKIHDLEAIAVEKDIALRDRISLEIRTDREAYHFFADGEEIGQASIASFSSEQTMYMTFTGTLLGIFTEDGDGSFEEGFGFTE